MTEQELKARLIGIYNSFSIADYANPKTRATIEQAVNNVYLELKQVLKPC